MPRRPNILWFMTDEQRADSMGYEGRPWARTPNLDRLARSGVRFRHAYTPSPVCVSARACMLTGRAGSSIGVLNNHHRLDEDNPRFLTWRFAAAGYQVASFGKHHYNCARRAFDVEGGRVLGDRVDYCAYRVPVDPQRAGVVRYHKGRTPWLFAGQYPGGVDATPEMKNAQDALTWIRGRDPARPYFLRLSFNAPHTPVVTPAPFDTLVDPSVINLPLARAATDGGDMTFVSETHRAYLWDYAGTQRLTDDQIRRARQCYYGYVACVDHVFGHFMDALAAMGELDNTMIVYVADHGAHLGDHGFFQKQSFWDVSARVPFFFTGPGIRQAPAPLTGPVSAGSLLPTLLDLAGLEVPPQVEFPSLKPVLCGDKDVAPAPVFSEIDYGLWGYRDGDRYVMVREGPWKLSLYRDPADSERFAGRDDRVLFNLDADPGERHNLAYDSDYKDVVEDLIARIDRWDRRRSLVRSDTDRK